MLVQEVLKRDVLEGEQAEAARRAVSRAANLIRRTVAEKLSDPPCAENPAGPKPGGTAS